MTRTPYDQPSADDYVECDECGHAIEVHAPKGCTASLDEGCSCPTGYTRDDKRAIRRRAGLPATWDVSTVS